MKSWRLRVGTAVLAAVSLTLVGCTDGAEPEPEISTQPPRSTATATAEASEAAERDPQLAAQLEELIVEELPPLSLRASGDIAADCGVEAGGCYLPESAAIIVRSDWTDFRRPELLAHEYLHYVWERDGLGEDAALTQALDAAAADDEGLGALVPSWQQDYVESDGSIMPTELFSYACTGLRAEQMEAALADRCGQYLRLDALPVAQQITGTALLEEIDRLRGAAGLSPLDRDANAGAASEARAALFTPYAQTPLDEYPESVRAHLDEGCAPARYGARLTRASDIEQQVQAIDALLQGALTSPDYTGIGIATAEFDYIDARELFGEGTLRVNATLIVTTVCG